MKNKKILATIILAGILASGISYSYANNTDTGSKNNGVYKMGKCNGKMLKNLTDEEKENLESMTKEQKKEFFDEKKEEHKAQKEAHENVIDKLLAGENLTSEEEALRQEIIEKRAEHKVEREAREAKREEMKPIFEKVKAGEELTDEEQAKLDEFKVNHPKKERKGGKGGNRGRGMQR